MNKVIHLSLARKSVPILMDVVQSATAPSIEFVLDDYTPPSNARARIYIKKDGGEVYNNCTLSGNVVTYTPTAGSFDVAGQCVAQLELVQGSTVAVSWRIFVTVEPNLINGSAAPASSEYNALTQLIVNAQRYDSIIGANNLTGYNNRQGWTALTTGQSLDAIYTPGVYACTDTVANTIDHPMKGYAGGFVMVVSLAANANTNYAQEIKYVSKSVSGMTLRRTAYTNREWGEWQRVVQNDEFLGALSRSGINMLSNQNPVGVQEINGLTITTNSDGTIVINGTATANTEYYYLSSRTETRNRFPAGQLWLSGCPAGGSTSTYRIGYNRGSTASTLGNDTGSGILINEPTGTNNYGVWIAINSGVVCDNLTFRPMVCDARLRYVGYVPYGMSNAELTEHVRTTSTIMSATLDATNTTGGNVQYVKVGRLVTVTGLITTEGDKPSGTIYATGLPLPLVAGVLIRALNNSAVASATDLYLSDAGEIKQSGAASGKRSLRFSVSYISQS